MFGLRGFRTIPALPLLALFSAAASAGVRAELRVLGFSSDGRYFAFEDSGEFDAEAGHWARVEVIDSRKDRRAHAPFNVSRPDEDASEPSRAAALAAAGPTLSALGVDLSDPGQAPALTLSSPDRASARFTLGGDAYEVALSSKDFAQEDCVLAGGRTRGFKLVLKGPRGESTLHDEGRVPATRGENGCVFRYALREIRAKGPYLVVLLDVEKPGFEGPSVDHMAVATKASPAR